jgi:hypothetical protein
MNMKKIYKLSILLSIVVGSNSIASDIEECENNKMEWAIKSDNISNHFKSLIDSLDFKNRDFLKEVEKLEVKIERTKFEIEKSEIRIEEIRKLDDEKYTEEEKEKNKKESDKNEENIEKQTAEQESLNLILKKLNDENKEKYIDPREELVKKSEKRMDEIAAIAEKGKCAENSLGEAYYILYK